MTRPSSYVNGAKVERVKNRFLGILIREVLSRSSQIFTLTVKAKKQLFKETQNSQVGLLLTSAEKQQKKAS